MNKEERKQFIDEMKEVFPTAIMMNNAFTNVQKQITAVDEKVGGVQRTVAEVSTDLIQLTTNIENVRILVANVPTKHDLEHWLEKTYNFSKLQVEHERIIKIIQDKLGVEV